HGGGQPRRIAGDVAARRLHRRTAGRPAADRPRLRRIHPARGRPGAAGAHRLASGPGPGSGAMSDWQAVIGLEIHVQLNTRSKLFSGASTAYGAEPNTQASFVDV